ncbi:MAG: hypothetical protein K9N29_10955 [Candidatus Marinimicrobia bacterium]|nr:hypothetical protein [Candidatus Neomarinimicrobiota bacterium]
MRKVSTLISVICLSLGLVGTLAAQPAFQFTIQSWASYTTYDHYIMSADSSGMILDKTTTQLGNGIRRARLRGKMTKGQVTAFVQYDAVSSYIVDAQIDYEFSDNLTLRMGRFVGPGSQAGGNTSHTAIDFAERSIVGRNWASAVGRSDYRTFGMAVIGKFNRFHYQIMAQNGNNSLNLLPYGTKSSHSNEDTGAIPQLDFAISTKIGSAMNVGLHYGLPNEDRINVSSATGFFYFRPADYTKGKFRSKFDFARVVNHATVEDEVSLGWGLGGFYMLSEKIELGAGYQNWDVNTDVDKDGIGNILLAATYSPNPEHWKDSLFKLVATFKTAEADNEPLDPMIIHMVWQVYMH